MTDKLAGTYFETVRRQLPEAKRTNSQCIEDGFIQDGVLYTIALHMQSNGEPIILQYTQPASQSACPVRTVRCYYYYVSRKLTTNGVEWINYLQIKIPFGKRLDINHSTVNNIVCISVWTMDANTGDDRWIAN